MPRLGRIALAAALALACAAPTAAAIEREIPIYLHENPLHTLPEQINADVGDVLKLRVENPEGEGKTVHNLLVCGDGEKPSESCDDRWAFTPMIQPGGSADIHVPMKKAGRFEYYCAIPGHKSGGMVGLLVVSGGGNEKDGVPAPGIGLALGIIALAALAFGRRRAP